MCNLYAQTKPQDAMRRAFEAIADDGALIEDLTGNLPSMPGIWPDYPAPILRRGRRDCSSHWPAGACRPRRTFWRASAPIPA